MSDRCSRRLHLAALDTMSDIAPKRYTVSRGGEDEPGLILIADEEKGIIVARSSTMALKYVQELVDLANRPSGVQ